jgi:hypothetical protein
MNGGGTVGDFHALRPAVHAVSIPAFITRKARDNASTRSHTRSTGSMLHRRSSFHTKPCTGLMVACCSQKEGAERSSLVVCLIVHLLRLIALPTQAPVSAVHLIAVIGPINVNVGRVKGVGAHAIGGLYARLNELPTD